MASPGWGNVFGKFVEGYMKGSAMATEQRQKRADGLMDMASKFATRTDAEPDESMAKFFADQSRQYLDEATKIQTEKVGAWHLLSKLFGGAKGDKKLNAMAPGIMQATAKKPEAEQAPQEIPVQQPPQTMAQAEEAFKGWTPGPGEIIPQQVSGAAAGGEPPLTRYPTPMQGAPPQWPSAAPVPPNLSFPPILTPAPAQPSIPRMLGGVPISRGEQREMTKSEFMAGRQEQRQETAAERQAHMTMEHNKEMATWQGEQADRYSFARADKWAQTNAAKELGNRDPQLYQDTIQFMQFGVPIRDRSYQLKEFDKLDPGTGKRTRQMFSVDPRTGSTIAKIGDPEEIPPSPHDLEVRPYMQGGKTYGEGEAAWAKDQMSEVNLTKQIRQLSIERSTETIAAQQQLNKLRQQKLDGKVDAAWAKNFEAIARPLSFQAGYVRQPDGMITGWDVNQAMAAFIQIVQFYGGMDWAEFQKLRGKTDTGRSTDEDNATWFLNQHKGQQQNPQVGITGAIGGTRGAPPPAGKPLGLPGVPKK